MLGRTKVSLPVCQFEQVPRRAVKFDPHIDLMKQMSIPRAARSLRKQIASTQSALAVLLELPRRFQKIERLARNHFRALKRKRLSVIANQQRLVVERNPLAMARRAITGRSRAWRAQGIAEVSPTADLRRPSCSRMSLFAEHGRQRERAKSGAARAATVPAAKRSVQIRVQ